MDFKKIKLLPVILGYFFIETLLVIISPKYGRLIYSLLLLFYFIYQFKKQNITFKMIKELLPNFKDLIKYFFMTISLLLISVAGVLVLYYALYLFITPDTANSMSESSPFTDVMPLWASFILAVIMAPITEEFIFRGLILNKVSEKYDIYLGIFISSFIFSILHANILGTFVFAVVQSVLYIKTKNIIAPIIVHFFNNLIAMLPNILSSDSNSATSYTEEAIEVLSKTECLELLETSIILFIIVSIPMIVYIYKNWSYLKSFNCDDEVINSNDSVKDIELLSLIKVEDNPNLSNIDEAIYGTQLEFNTNPKKE